MTGNIYYVYAHYDGQGNLKYIGKGKENRAWGHIQRSDRWKSFFETHERTVKILEDGLTECQALDLEIELIAAARRNGADLLNFGDGGERGARYWLGKKRDPELMKKLAKASHTREAIEKRKLKMIGKTLSEKSRKKISDANKGRKMTEDQKIKISKAKTGRPNGLEGRVMPQEHRMKISESRKTSSKVLASSQKIWETRRANGTASGFKSKKAKAVQCIETGEIFRTAKEAADKMFLSDKHIQACCVGRRPRHGGYTWSYV